MNKVAPDAFETMIRDAGQGHLIDWYAPKAEALSELRELLKKADECAQQRLGGNAPRLTPEHLAEEYSHNPHKVQAFLQILASASPDMLVMVWRILQGLGVAAIRMEYEAESHFQFFVRLALPGDTGDAEEYESKNIDDAVVLRHLGIMKMSGKPLFDGFYALNLGRS